MVVEVCLERAEKPPLDFVVSELLFLLVCLLVLVLLLLLLVPSVERILACCCMPILMRLKMSFMLGAVGGR